jgi:3-oxoacyl-[acyl-carrier-protein] synthase-1
MRTALADAGHDICYINPHATATPVGDVAECAAIHRVFGEDGPYISATKSMTGHSLGGAGVQEAIYSLIMMQDGFIAPSININELDPEIPPLNIVQQTRDHNMKAFMSNSFGFGGTNGSVIMRKI